MCKYIFLLLACFALAACASNQSKMADQSSQMEQKGNPSQPLNGLGIANRQRPMAAPIPQ